MATLEFFYDFISPYSYLASVRVVYHIRENTQYMVSGHDIAGNKTFTGEQLASSATSFKVKMKVGETRVFKLRP